MIGIEREREKGQRGRKSPRWLATTVFLGILALALCFPATAYAYLDPGSGSYFFMMLAAGFLALAFWIKSIFRTLKNFFSGLFQKKPKSKP